MISNENNLENLVESKFTFLKKILAFLTNNIVTIIFAVFVLVGFFASPAISVSGLVSEVMSRFFRNGLLVIALIIPVMAGLGLNFGIVVGAIAAVLAIIPVRYIATVPYEEMSAFTAFLYNSFLQFGNIGGLILCFIIAVPLALLFGYLTGKLYNKTRGQEMIAGIIVSFFAEGLLLIFVLFVIGGIIPVAAAHPMIIPSTVDGVPVPGVGVRMTFEMGLHSSHPIAARDPYHQAGLASSLDFLWQVDFLVGLLILSACVFAFIVIRRGMSRISSTITKIPKMIFGIVCAVWGIILAFALYTFFIPHGLIFRFGDGAFNLALPGSPLAGMSMVMPIAFLVIAGFCLFTIFFAYKNPRINKTPRVMFILRSVLWGALVLVALHGLFLPGGLIFHFTGGGSFAIPPSPLLAVGQVPVATGLVIAAFCLFTFYFTKTKLGQDCRSVGQSQPIANAAGINVDRTRIIATMISTVIAAGGMIIFLQNMGHVNTYSAHRQIGMFSVAALLVGGATASKAGIKNAMFGLLLFHAMFVVSPGIGRLISGNELVAEAVRSFMVYGVIGLALGLHVWKTAKAARDKNRLPPIPADSDSNDGLGGTLAKLNQRFSPTDSNVDEP